MIKASDLTKESYKSSDVASLLNVHIRTVQNWDRQGSLKFKRTTTGRRVVFRDDLIKYLDLQGLIYNDDKINKVDVIYARVSSNEQKNKGDLNKQILSIVESVKDLQNPVILKEVGSGLNDKRKQFQNLINMVLDNKVSRIFVTYKDRLTRFGFNYIDTICKKMNVKIIILNDKETKLVQEELVDDMMTLIASFSGKLYGLRSNKNKKKIEEEMQDER